jgi:predicted glycosyltransferase
LKHLPPRTALYSKVWLSEIATMAEEAIWLHVPEETFYGSIGTDYPIPRLGEFIRTHDVINIESDVSQRLKTAQVMKKASHSDARGT